MSGQDRASVFVVGRNPQEDSKLPYLLRLPLEGGLVLKARELWPATARVYCHRFEEPWHPWPPSFLQGIEGLFQDLLDPCVRERMLLSKFFKSWWRDIFSSDSGKEQMFVTRR